MLLIDHASTNILTLR